MKEGTVMEFNSDLGYKILSLTMAVAVGYGYSGSIIILATLVLPSLPAFIPAAAFLTFIKTAFFSSVLTWAAAHYNKIYRVVKGLKPSPQEIKTSAINQVNVIKQLTHTDTETFKPNDDMITTKIYTEMQKMYYTISPNINAQNEGEKSLAYKIAGYISSLFGMDTASYTINQNINRMIGLYSLLSDDGKDALFCTTSDTIKQMDNALQNKNKNAFFKAFAKHSTVNRNPSNETPLDEEYWGIIEKSVAARAKTSLIKHTFQNLGTSFMTFATYFNAFALNNFTLVLFGALPLAAMIGANMYVKYALVAYFTAVGTIAALSFSKPTSLQAYASIFHPSKLVEKARKNSVNSGILPKWVKQLLSTTMALGIVIQNVLSTIALGEILFAGKSLFSESLFINILTNPFNAHPYSIALGITGGVALLPVLTCLFLSGTMGLEAPLKKNSLVKQTPNKQNEGITSFYNIVHDWAVLSTITGFIALAAVTYMSVSSSLIAAHIYPAVLACCGLAATKEYYLQIAKSKHTLVNAAIFLTTVSAAATTYVFGVQAGSIFIRILGNTGAKAFCSTAAAANLALLPPMFNDKECTETLESFTTLGVR